MLIHGARARGCCYRLLQEVYLSQGQEVVIQSPGFESRDYVEGCEVGGELFTEQSDDENIPGQV